MNKFWYTIVADNSTFQISYDTLKKFPNSLLYKIAIVGESDKKIKKIIIDGNVSLTLDMDTDSVRQIISYMRGYNMCIDNMPKVLMDMKYLNIAYYNNSNAVDKLASDINIELEDGGTTFNEYNDLSIKDFLFNSKTCENDNNDDSDDFEPIENFIFNPKTNHNNTENENDKTTEINEEIIQDIKNKISLDATVLNISNISNDRNIMQLIKNSYNEDDSDIE